MSPLISPSEAHQRIAREDAVVLDCRFRLSDPHWGRRAYEQAHLPGAHYAHLDHDLSDPGRPGLGRHPLPRSEDFAATLGRWGIDRQRPVIVYDDAGGIIAARAWWLLRHAGHRRVQVLDGGVDAWLRCGLPVEDHAPAVSYGGEACGWGCMPALDTESLQRALEAGQIMLVDARASERFEGREEPLDTVAGHVPGAVNRPFSHNLRGGLFKPISQLERQWRAWCGDRPPDTVVHMCGSGVTACHNLLAMEAAGLCGSALYWPSWSGWIAGARPIATGP